VNKFSATQSTWTISFVLDLQPYDDFLNALRGDLTTTENLATTMTNKYLPTNAYTFLDLYLSSLQGLNAEIQTLYSVYIKLLHKVNSNKFIRQKRALFDFGSDILRAVFGVAKDSDIQQIRSVLSTLHQRQLRLMHVSSQSLTILNLTQNAVKENRNSLNDVISTLSKVEVRLRNVTEEVNARLLETNNFMVSYFHLDLLIQEVRDLMSRATLMFEHLDNQLTALSLGHLSPNLIPPYQLKELLLEIKNELPPLNTLPFDIEKGILEYYKYLPLSGIIENNKMVMVVKIPLNEQYEYYQMYSIINIPLTFANTTKSQLTSNMAVAKYDIPYAGIAINSKQTKYALLESGEISSCIGAPFCQLMKPLYPIELSNTCIVHIFMNKQDLVAQNCRELVKPDTQLPYAEYITNGVWVVVTPKPLRLSITCKRENNLESSWSTINPPFDIITIPQGCTAINDLITLSATFDYKSTVTITDDFVQIMKKTLNISSLSIWKDYNEKLIDYGPIEIPKTLPSVGFIPMDSLLNEVELAREYSTKKKFNMLSFFTTGVVTLIIIGLLAYVIKVKCKNRCNRKFIQKFRYFGKRSGTEMGPGEVLMASVNASAPVKENFTDMVGPSKNKGNLNYIALYPKTQETAT